MPTSTSWSHNMFDTMRAATNATIVLRGCSRGALIRLPNSAAWPRSVTTGKALRLYNSSTHLHTLPCHQKQQGGKSRRVRVRVNASEDTVAPSEESPLATNSRNASRSAQERVLTGQGKLTSAAQRRSEAQPEWLKIMIEDLAAQDHSVPLLEYLRDSYPKVHGYLELPMAAVLGHLSSFQHGRGWEGSCVEIGVFNGASFFPLVLTTRKGEAAVGIDCFEEQEANIDDSGFGASVPSTAAFEAALRRHVKDDATRRRAMVVCRDSSELDSSEVLGWLPEGQRVRIFSVDGCHTAASTENDCSLAAACLAPGGVIMVDDVFNSHWPSVSVGLLRFLEGHPTMTPFFIGFNKVLVCEAHLHGDFLSEMKGLPSFCKCADFGGHTVAIHRQGWLAAMFGND